MPMVRLGMRGMVLSVFVFICWSVVCDYDCLVIFSFYIIHVKGFFQQTFIFFYSLVWILNTATVVHCKIVMALLRLKSLIEYRHKYLHNMSFILEAATLCSE